MLFRPLDEKLCIQTLLELLPGLQQMAMDADEGDDIDNILCILAEIINSLYLLHRDTATFIKSVTLDLVTELTRRHGSDVHVLRLADVYFTCAKQSGENNAVVEEQVLSGILSKLQDNLSSPDSQVSHTEQLEQHLRNRWCYSVFLFLAS